MHMVKNDRHGRTMCQSSDPFIASLLLCWPVTAAPRQGHFKTEDTTSATLHPALCTWCVTLDLISRVLTVRIILLHHGCTKHCMRQTQQSTIIMHWFDGIHRG